MLTLELSIDTLNDSFFFDRNLNKSLKSVEESLGVVISSRGDKLFIQGEENYVKVTQDLILDIYNLKKEGYLLRHDEIAYMLDSIKRNGTVNIRELFQDYVKVATKKKFVIPRTVTQKHYINAIKTHDIVIGIGPAGTGKTYIAMAMAINSYIEKKVNRIILIRPAIEAGEKLGFLPGDMYEKVNPYLRPLYDALFDMMDTNKANLLIEKGIIEIAPLAFMRGRTLNDSFIILDEAQNTTSEQMKMYLTRLGFNSRTVITGDTTQIDLPQDKSSGLIEAERVLKEIRGIKFVYFTDKDVVRHKLVQEIVKAYEKFEKREKEETKAKTDKD